MSSAAKQAFAFEVDGRRQTAGGAWFRGENCNFNPAQENMIPSHTVLKHVLAGWLPEKPLIGPETTVTAFGSCFAAHIRDWLHSRDYNVLTKGAEYGDTYISRFGEGLVNSFVLRQQFEWAWTDAKFSEELWHGYSAEAYGYDERIRQKTRETFDRTDVFIITLGLSEIWYDEQTGGVFWRAIPKDKFDPRRHKFRVATVAETRDNIRAIYDLVSRYRPQAKIIFTVSPVPLVATFRPVSCITANSASKAIIRAALDEVLREVSSEGRAFYWPSFEIVMDVFADGFRADRRHVKREVLDFIMNLFEHTWCYGTTPRYTVSEAWINARCADGTLPPRLSQALAESDLATIDRIFEGLPPTHAALIVERAEEIGQTNEVFADWAKRKAPRARGVDAKGSFGHIAARAIRTLAPGRADGKPARSGRGPNRGRHASASDLPPKLVQALTDRNLGVVKRFFRHFIKNQKLEKASALLDRVHELRPADQALEQWMRRQSDLLGAEGNRASAD